MIIEYISDQLWITILLVVNALLANKFYRKLLGMSGVVRFIMALGVPLRYIQYRNVFLLDKFCIIVFVVFALVGGAYRLYCWRNNSSIVSSTVDVNSDSDLKANKLANIALVIVTSIIVLRFCSVI